MRSIFKDSILRRILGGAFWSLSGTVVAKLLFLSSGILIANILGKELYGELGIIRSTINMFIVISWMGLGITTSKFVSEYKNVFPEKIHSIYTITKSFGILLGALIAIIIIVFSSTICRYIGDYPHLNLSLKLGTILLFFSSINGVQNGFLAGFEQFRTLAGNILITSIFEFVLVIIGGFLCGINGVILGSGISYILLWWLNNRCIRKLLRKLPPPLESEGNLCCKSFMVVWKFALPTSLSAFLIMPVMWYVKTLLVKSYGFAEVANFDVAEQWRTVLMFIPGALGNIILPILSSTRACNQKSEYWRAFNINLGINIFITFFLFCFILLVGKYILRLYGTNFTDVLPLYWMAFSTIFVAAINVLDQTIASSGKMWMLFTFNGIWALLLCVLSYILVENNGGALGLAISYTVSYFLSLLIRSYYIFKRRRNL